jgi:starvation-inducible DNA-binding protein
MEDLIEQLKVTLATNFAFYLKTHLFHWNVEGTDFPQYHSFFERLYTDVWEASDTIAELIRTLDVFSPGSLGRFKELSKVKDQVNLPLPYNMFVILLDDNEVLTEELNKSYSLAEKYKKFGISNILQDRISAHDKWNWQIRSVLKRQ